MCIIKGRQIITVKMLLLILCLFTLTACTINGNHSAAMDYIPYAEIPKDYTLENAKDDGLVVFEDGSITMGQSIWDDFVVSTENREPNAVRLAFYYTLDNQNISPEHYAEIKDDYPVLYIQDLSFNGSEYTLYSVEGTEEYTFNYKYLKRFEETSPPATALYSKRIWYALVNDSEVTGEQIQWGMLSSQSGDYIDHKTVYSKYI